MGFEEISRNIHQVWENRPRALILLILGFVVFVLLVIDTWRHKRRRKRPR